eukprot:Tamp_10450.p1 GENE.Tamp_10450~~Tamp_10450.p1  ORF type:complete len:367 (+),score=94.84 Tamp_10450:526-1626(+)
MQQQEDPAVQTRAGQGFARTQKLWNAAANDEVMQLESPPKWSAGKVNGEITAYEGAADDQGSKAHGIFKSIFKSARTQDLFIVPQANVLTGQGQEKVTATGKEDAAAEKKAEEAGAQKLVTKAAKLAALQRKKDQAKTRAQSHAKLSNTNTRAPSGTSTKAAAGQQMGHPKPFSGPMGGDVRPFAAKQVMRLPDKSTALWNAAEESPESKAVKRHTKPSFGVPLKGAYRGYHAKRQRSFLPADYHAPGATYKTARQQALWNAAADGGHSNFFRPAPTKVFGVPLKGAYRGYHARQQQSYLPADYHAPGATFKAAQTTELWDAAANDASLQSTRRKLGMVASSASALSSAHSSQRTDAQRDYLAAFQ